MRPNQLHKEGVQRFVLHVQFTRKRFIATTLDFRVTLNQNERERERERKEEKREREREGKGRWSMSALFRPVAK